MASTNKTPKLGLNQWVPGDAFLRADFNRDNAKLDEQLGHLADGLVTGTYRGDGKENRIIHLGFKPKLLLMQGLFYGSQFILVAFYERATLMGYNRSEDVGYSVKLIADGIACGTSISFINELNTNYYYMAFR